jgi:hypothetical protein
MADIQDYNSHVRWHPIFHFVLAPLMLVNFVYSIVRLVQDPGWDRVEYLLLAIGLVILTLLSRTYAIKVQDRVIRLEEQLRFGRLLDGDLADKAMNLKHSQYVALRFASDEEVPGLVERIASGELKDQKEIKLAVKNWRADHFRV